MLNFIKIGALTSKPYAFNARPWELKSVNTIDILDSFGSSIRLDYRDKEILRVLPRNAEWISDKVRFFYDSFKYQRFHYPYLRKQGVLVKINLIQVLFFFKLICTYLNCFTFFFKIGALTDVEAMFSAKTIVSTLNTKGILSNLFYDLKGNTNANIKNYYFNIDFLKKTELILLVDLNLRLENPVLNAFLRKQSLIRSSLKIFVIGASVSYNYYVKHLGNNSLILNSILNGKHKLNLLLTKCILPLFLFGSSFFYRADSNFFFSAAQNLKLLNNDLHIINLPYRTSMLGGFELGVENYISTYKKNDLNIMFMIGTKNSKKYYRNSTKFLVYQSSNYSDCALTADLIIPEATFIEKENLHVTLNNGLLNTKKIYNPPKEAREGWEVLQYILFFIYKLPLKQEQLLFKDTNNYSVVQFKANLLSRIYKRSVFSTSGSCFLFLKEPTIKNVFHTSNFLNVINLYYNNDLMSNVSLNLNVRSNIEQVDYINFENKNGVN